MGDDPVLYQIRVNGHLGPTLLTAFPAFVPEQQGTETVLTGLLPDAAALFGVLSEIEALGLDLLEVRRVRPRLHQDLSDRAGPDRQSARPNHPPPKGDVP
ncbi:hypothetical protein [Streptomyces sp. GESEQ-35]|uniref:hypothetical protein n=1 Tax=Streptomyces sp. GESEQ-35 TaxID=2812657 RepID=UPI001B3240C0|nr:hypothetical protein [Streptomyces sp. GESEQ-35]